jgi:hypothetical protein
MRKKVVLDGYYPPASLQRDVPHKKRKREKEKNYGYTQLNQQWHLKYS